MTNSDQKTANAFATSWNNLPGGSVYTRDQFEDWMTPLTRSNIEGKSVLELGCGNASLMVHMSEWNPAYLEGVDLGDSVASARTNMGTLPFKNWKVTQGDLKEFKGAGYDVVYCIGVIHHLKDPKKGLDSIVGNTKSGGKFHVWVYAKEGNAVIRYFVDPIRHVASRLSWWVTKYFLATPLVVPFYIYAHILALFPSNKVLKVLPLYEYSLWISKREFSFFRHVAFDQLVTPQTTYISQQTIRDWLSGYPQVDQSSVYCTMRNGNSWKFGGILK